MLSYTLMGKGFGFWNTMPTRFLSVLMSTLPYRSTPSMSISPVILQSGMRSFMRLSDFKKVDLPQPEGPINAVISFSRISILMFLSAQNLP